MAMATGLAWEEVFLVAPFGEAEFYYGLTLRQVVTTLRRLDHSPRWHWPEWSNPDKVGRPLRDKMRGRDGIYLLPSISKDEEGAFHYVVISDGKIYDPAPRWKRQYRNYKQFLPLGAVYLP